jgi:hypothetical protein
LCECSEHSRSSATRSAIYDDEATSQWIDVRAGDILESREACAYELRNRVVALDYRTG